MSASHSGIAPAPAASLEGVAIQSSGGRFPLLVALPLITLASMALWALVYKAASGLVSILG